MAWRLWLIWLILGTITAFAQPCATCHSKIAQSFRDTGMARSFYRPAPSNTVEDYTNRNTYYHQPSGMYFSMVQREGRCFQRQYQIGFDGKQTNLVEKQIDFVLGSGDHARTYLHRTAEGTLQQLPLGWYAENGGYWAMNPGYDRPDHQGFRRNVTYDCMFCHNAYPEIPLGNDAPRSTPVYSRVPEGIDCQRCHGNGDRHAALAAGATASGAEIRAAIVNPSRLPIERQMDVCLQCHLETTSSPLPALIVRYERRPFSYRPGEPLSDFTLHFDQQPSPEQKSRFEITGSAYRLRQSKCFLASKGELKCTTCHDPHAVPRGQAAARHFTEACRGCHVGNLGKAHPASDDCIGCHMSKRRTSDVVHVVITDHLIVRTRPSGDLLAPIAEKRQTDANAYRGEVVPYMQETPDSLYLAIAQVTQSSNLIRGLEQLRLALDKYRPARAEYYLQYGDALSAAGKPEDALAAYEDAVRREPESVAAQERLALGLSSVQQFVRAEEILQRLLTRHRENARLWVELGSVEAGVGKTREALAAFERAAQADPEMPEAWNSAGAILFETGESAARAEDALRNAIRVQPNFAPAHNNLGNLLSAAGRFEESAFHLEAAIRLQENYVGARYNYALALSRVRRFEEAQGQMEAVLKIAPQSAEAHEFLGNLLAARGQTSRAIEQYREALRIAPQFDRANLDLGTALANAGDSAAALPYLRAAAQSQDSATRDAALKLLQKLAKPD
jgi:predicted CXXCH cytochrome family protein